MKKLIEQNNSNAGKFSSGCQTVSGTEKYKVILVQSKETGKETTKQPLRVFT